MYGRDGIFFDFGFNTLREGENEIEGRGGREWLPLRLLSGAVALLVECLEFWTCII